MIQNNISIILVYRALKNSIFKIAFLSFLTSFIYIGHSYTIKDVFESRAVLQLSETERVQMPSLGGLGGLASSMSGMDLSGGADYKISLAIERLRSRDFLNHIIKDESILNNILSEEDKSDPKKILTIAHKKYVEDILYIRQDRKSGFLNIVIAHHSPDFAKSFLELIVYELNEISRSYDFEQAQSAIDYYNKEIANTAIKDIRSAMSNLMEVQLQRKMLTNVRKDYMLQYIDSPYLPIYKSKPRRSSYAITGFLLGFFLSALFFIITYKD